jgi:hypothetical protein
VEPSYSIIWSAKVVGSTVTSVGNIMIPSASVAGQYIIATTANRGARGSEGVSLTDYSGTQVGPIDLQQSGMVDASITGLPTAATRQLVRTSATGTMERISSYSAGDDVIGYAELDGRVHLMFGFPVDAIIAFAGGGGGFTAGGDLSGTSTNQTVQKVKGTTITTAGGALPVGAVLRTTAVGTADWGTVDLADTDAVTGTLPVVRGGTNITTSGLSGQANKALTVNVGETGYQFTTIPAGASTPTGTGFRHVTSGTEDAAAALVVNVDVSASAAIAASKLAPPGSTTQASWNNAGTWAGASGLLYDSTNNQPQAPNGYVITAGGFRMVLAGTPTATRTLTFPDTTDTVVTLSAVQTLGNKTWSISGNTLLDGTNAAGDLLINDATKYRRVPRGSANQVLQTNAGATDIGWATLSVGANPAGSGLEMQARATATTFAAITNWSNSSGNILGASGGWIAFGGSGGATTGDIRLKSGATYNLFVADDGGGGNRAALIIANLPSALITYGLSAFNTVVNGASTDLQVGGASYVKLQSSLAQYSVPRVGNSTPYASEGKVTIGTYKTLTSAEYSRLFIELTPTVSTSGTYTFPLPASNDASYFKIVYANQTATTVTISDGTHSIAGPSISTTGITTMALMFTPSGIYVVSS